MELLVMAAGMGSRFGGLKQLTPVGPNGEFLIDYSIYDAKKCGVNKVVFVIKKEMEPLFKETIGKRLENHIKVEYVYQMQEDTPIPITIKRKKPWGTGQALLASRNAIDDVFMVINADDFYGRDAFYQLANFLKETSNSTEKQHYGMVGYLLKNTLSDNGSVSRGLCELEDGYLKTIKEHTKIIKQKDKILSLEEGVYLKEDELVSLNLFGFQKTIFEDATHYFKEFLENNKDLETKEFYLPSIVQKMVDDQLADVKVLSTSSSFHGMTYKEDLDALKIYINTLIQKGVYPNKLWGDENEK